MKRFGLFLLAAFLANVTTIGDGIANAEGKIECTARDAKIIFTAPDKMIFLIDRSRITIIPQGDEGGGWGGTKSATTTIGFALDTGAAQSVYFFECTDPWPNPKMKEMLLNMANHLEMDESIDDPIAFLTSVGLSGCKSSKLNK